MISSANFAPLRENFPAKAQSSQRKSEEKVKKAILKTVYNLGAFAPFHRLTRGKILILMYHRFSREANKYKISSWEFAAHLEYLSKHNQVLSLGETINRLKTGETLPPNAAVITIDDGYADAFEIAFPLLKKFDFPATVYAVTDFLDGKCWLWTDFTRWILQNTKSENLRIEFADGEKIEADLKIEIDRLEIAAQINSKLKRLPDDEKDLKIKEIAKDLNVKIPDLPIDDFAPVTWEQAREMDANKMAIESHTVTHPILTNINQERLDFELQTSKKRLENNLQKEIKHFCYPNGTLNAAVRKSVENAGYESAVTTAYGFNEKQTNQFALNRIDAAAAIENFAQSVSGFEALRQK